MSNPYDKPQGPKFKQITITVDPDVWRQLIERNKNLSAICRDALLAELQRCLSAEVHAASNGQRATVARKAVRR